MWIHIVFLMSELNGQVFCFFFWWGFKFSNVTFCLIVIFTVTMTRVLICSTVLVMLAVPTSKHSREICQRFLSDLASFGHVDHVADVLKPVVCSVCDGAPTCPHWFDWVPLKRFREMTTRANMQKAHLSTIHSELLLSHCTVDHSSLQEFVLSPNAVTNESEEVMVCKECHAHLQRGLKNGNLSRVFPPPRAICNGHVIGNAPKELTQLNQAELALVSGARIVSQSHVFCGGCHQQIRGWHTTCRNRVVANVSDINMLRSSGLKGKIVVVLCGPFTRTQRALVMDQIQVCPEKVTDAFRWLKKNNFYCHDMELPRLEEIPIPVTVDENV